MKGIERGIAAVENHRIDLSKIDAEKTLIAGFKKSIKGQ